MHDHLPSRELGAKTFKDLVTAIDAGDCEGFQSILRDEHFNLNSSVLTKFMFIATMTPHCDVDILQLLHSHGADVNAKNQEGFYHRLLKEQCIPGWSLATAAFLTGNLRKLQWLIRTGMDVDLQQYWGCIPLSIALFSENKNENFRDILSKAGCDGFTGHRFGRRSKNCICSLRTWGESEKEMMSLIIKTGVDDKGLVISDFFPLEDMVTGEEAENTVTLLLAQGARMGRTLHAAVVFNRPLIGTLLINGAMPTLISIRIDYDLSRGRYLPPCANANSQHAHTVSPFTLSLISGDVRTARQFLDIWFLSTHDILFGERLRKVKTVLEKRHREDSLGFLEEVTSSPWPLHQLSFITVSTLVGFQKGRENRVEQLPLPRKIKDQLKVWLFDSQ